MPEQHFFLIFVLNNLAEYWQMELQRRVLIWSCEQKGAQVTPSPADQLM